MILGGVSLIVAALGLGFRPTLGQWLAIGSAGIASGLILAFRLGAPRRLCDPEEPQERKRSRGNENTDRDTDCGPECAAEWRRLHRESVSAAQPQQPAQPAPRRPQAG